MTDINKELEEMAGMLAWLTNNLDKLPLTYQVRFLSALMDLVENVKPIYVNSLMLLGNMDNEQKEDK